MTSQPPSGTALASPSDQAGFRLEILEDHNWAQEVADRLSNKLSSQPTARICLPTGETPRPAYQAAAHRIQLGAATVFLLDEFELPSGSSARCDYMLERDLLGSLKEAPAAYHRLHVNADDPAAEVARFDGLVAAGGLDLALLGLGGNGHLGLNEPGTEADSLTRQTPIAASTTEAVGRYDRDASPLRGMTLGLQRILAASEIWLLVTGAHKASPLERMINGPIGPEMPASFLRTHANTTVFANRSAAQLL